MQTHASLSQVRRWSVLLFFWLVSPLALPAAVEAGIVILPVGGYTADVDTGVVTTVERLNGGRILVQTVGLMGTAIIDCDGDPDCIATDFDQEEGELDQDLQIVIDRRSGKIRGKSQGSFTIPGLCKFRANLKGRASCVGAGPTPCNTLDVEFRLESPSFVCPSDVAPSQNTFMQLQLQGTLAFDLVEPPTAEWLMLEGEGELRLHVRGNP